MNIVAKVLQSVRHKPGAVVLRKDLAHLGGSSQITEALNKLVERGDLVRVSTGVYAKSSRLPDGRTALAADADQVVSETLRRLGKGNGVSVIKRSQHDVDVVLGPPSVRLFRRWNFDGIQVEMRRDSGLPPPKSKTGRSGEVRAQAPNVRPLVRGAANVTKVALPSTLPKTNVAGFITDLARRSGVATTRTKLDEFAEVVTKMAGDEVKLDHVGQTLVALKERKVVSGLQMNTLLLNHLREMRGVRSVR